MQPKQGSERFVLNKDNSSGMAIVHKIDCGAIRHQVEQDVREELPCQDFIEIGQDSTGVSLYRESTRWDTFRYEDSYVTRDELAQTGLRYRPCKICNPDLPSCSQVKSISIHAVDLKSHHLGKFFFGWGILERFVITCQLDKDERPEVFIDAYFDKETSHRFQPDDVLEYPRQIRTKTNEEPVPQSSDHPAVGESCLNRVCDSDTIQTR